MSEAHRTRIERPGSRWTAAAALLGIGGIALLVRAAKLPFVLLGEGSVLFAVGDAWYHARRALFSLEHFPSVLLFDNYVNFPDGAWVPFPPLWDLALAAFARAVASDLRGFEAALAWAPALIGALTVLPVYATARRLAGRGTALGAALLLALLPIHVRYSELGNPDHHAAVALCGAALLALYVHLLASPPDARAQRWWLLAALAGVRWLLLMVWQGSLLYLGAGAGLLGLTIVAGGRRDLLFGAAASALLTLLLTAPVVGALGPSLSGPYSAVELSRFHLLFLAAEAALFAGLGLLEWLHPARGAALRLARAGALTALVAGTAWAGVPGLRQGIAVAAEWMGQGNAWGARSAEQLPIFGPTLFRADSLYGYLAFLLPLAPLAALARARVPQLRLAACFLAGWTLLFGVLAVRQLRYGNDFAPAACVAFALLLAEVAGLARKQLGTTRTLSRGIAISLGALLMGPALLGIHGPQLRGSARLLGARPVEADLVGIHPTAALVRFARLVREATPETAGYLQARVKPSYGILCPPNIGHVLHYVARRATPADNFGPWAGEAHFLSVQEFYQLHSERAALAVMQRLHTPYVVTMAFGEPTPGTLMQRLHDDDGAASANGARLRHFRLVTEGPAGGAPLDVAVGAAAPGEGTPYKLFEAVRGAVIEVSAPAGSPVSAELRVGTPTGRSFRYRAEETAGEDGTARLRVPYATQTAAPVQPVAPYRVQAGERSFAVTVSDEDVRTGAVVRVQDTLP